MRWWIPGGDFSTWLTLWTMRRLVRQSAADRLTVETAHSIVSSCSPRDRRCELDTLRSWLAGRFRFVRDPAEQETLRPPRALLEQLARDGVVSGDCDDAAILAGALTYALGYRPQAVVTGFRHAGAAFQHVYTVVPVDDDGTEWVDFDVSRPADRPPVTPTRSNSWQLGGVGLWHIPKRDRRVR